jgi:predicted porin
MKKKLMAVAVAGALAAPALAVAQTSTVQVYGRITYEYGIIDQGEGQRSTDYADSPGGSAIGFRGEEKLGGGLSAWFQCESSADVRALDQTGWCTRNSAVGFKGGWGNVHFGRWDTPMKRALNVGTVGAEETGILGMSFLPFGGSGGADASATNAGGESQQRQRWKRRESALSYYESPRFNGFQVLGAFSSGNAGADNNPADVPPAGVANAVPRVWSLAGTYQNGPWGVGLAYEKHENMGAGGTVDLDDKAWGISGSYTFGGNIKVGATYMDQEYETGPATDLSRKTWTIGVDWRIQGPHSVQAQYANADDCEGTGTIGGNGGCTGTVTAGGLSTGGQAFSLAYSYAFSKRTRIKLGWVRTENDDGTRSFRIGNSATLTRTGEKVDGYAFHIQHNF